jgi:hypothetical protein
VRKREELDEVNQRLKQFFADQIWSREGAHRTSKGYSNAHDRTFDSEELGTA